MALSQRLTTAQDEAKSLRERVDALELSARTRELDDAIESGAVLDVERDALISLARVAPEDFDTRLEAKKANPVVPTGRIYASKHQGAKDADTEVASLTDEQRVKYRAAFGQLRDHEKTMTHLRKRGVIEA